MDPRIVLVRKHNGGQASAINEAFSRVRGDIICLLDADDIFEPTKLGKVAEAFTENPQTGLVIHDLLIIDREGEKRGVSRFRHGGYLGPEVPTLRMGLPLPQASGLSFRREVLEQILPLPEDKFRTVADWAVGYTAAYITNTAVVPEVLARYRIHGRNTSGTTSTASKLEEKLIGGILSGMERVITFVDQFMRRRYGLTVPMSKVRNVLEHRLMLGLLRKDKELITSSARDLSFAYRRVRRNYPAYRYFFWQFLRYLPTTISHHLLVLAFYGFRLSRRLRPSA